MSNDKVFVIHDSFRSTIWEEFEFVRNKNQYNILIDTHQYTAWNGPYSSFENLLTSSNNWQSPKSKYPYLIGEWSLAIDNCEMWLNGFMDNLPNYPLFECAFQPCFNHDKFKFELSQSINGPFGAGISSPKEIEFTNIFECPITIPLHHHFYTTLTEKELAEKLFIAKSVAFEKFTSGWIYWNFRTESSSYQWDYLAYIKLIEKENEYEDTFIVMYKQNNNLIAFLICSSVILLLIISFCIFFLKKKSKENNTSNLKQFENKNYQSINI
jgi:glucan 1,3-beta-glucosidase